MSWLSTHHAKTSCLQALCRTLLHTDCHVVWLGHKFCHVHSCVLSSVHDLTAHLGLLNLDLHQGLWLALWLHPLKPFETCSMQMMGHTCWDVLSIMCHCRGRSHLLDDVVEVLEVQGHDQVAHLGRLLLRVRVVQLWICLGIQDLRECDRMVTLWQHAWPQHIANHHITKAC